MKSSKEDGLRGLRQAANDREMTELLLREGFFAQAGFNAHQVSEKALQAMACYRGDRYVFGHSPTELVADLESTCPRLSEYRELAAILDSYYVPTRYPNALPGSVPFEVYGRRQAEDAVAVVGALMETARSLIED
jgi:HEPN domain-containing protein